MKNYVHVEGFADGTHHVEAHDNGDFVLVMENGRRCVINKSAHDAAVKLVGFDPYKSAIERGIWKEITYEDSNRTLS